MKTLIHAMIVIATIVICTTIISPILWIILDAFKQTTHTGDWMATTFEGLWGYAGLGSIVVVVALYPVMIFDCKRRLATQSPEPPQARNWLRALYYLAFLAVLPYYFRVYRRSIGAP